jgi:hypothetical protein
MISHDEHHSTTSTPCQGNTDVKNDIQHTIDTAVTFAQRLCANDKQRREVKKDSMRQ